VFTSLMCAAVAAARGQVKTAARWYRQAIAALHGADPGGSSFTGLVGLTGTLGMTGDAPQHGKPLWRRQPRGTPHTFTWNRMCNWLGRG
jgi:hypothetical protein